MRWIENYKVLRDPLRDINLVRDAQVINLKEEDILPMIDVAPPQVLTDASYVPDHQLATVLCPQQLQMPGNPKQAPQTAPPPQVVKSQIAPQPGSSQGGIGISALLQSLPPAIKPEKTHSIKKVLMWYILQR